MLKSIIRRGGVGPRELLPKGEFFLEAYPYLSRAGVNPYV